MYDPLIQILIDTDGTLYSNFRRDDKLIINIIFGKNLLVKFLDWLLWLINSLEIIPCTMLILKTRLFIYSILSFKSYRKVKEEYKKRYQNLLKVELSKTKKALENLSENYVISIITNNEFAFGVLRDFFPHYEVYYCKNTIVRSRVFKHLNNEIRPIIVGDNLIDDVLFPKLNKISYIYLGKSIFGKKINKYGSFEDFLKKVTN